MSSPSVVPYGTEFWVFGYGSIIWKQNFPFVETVPSYICGYRRVFYQGSTDHRGVPGAPGRVVTLLPAEPEHRVYGLAFRIRPEDRDEVIERLDMREQCGYVQAALPVFIAEGTPRMLVDCGLVYIAEPHNDVYLGEAPDHHIAKEIMSRRGKSGENSEYLFRLAEGLRLLGFHDPHVFSIEREAHKLLVHDPTRHTISGHAAVVDSNFTRTVQAQRHAAP